MTTVDTVGEPHPIAVLLDREAARNPGRLAVRDDHAELSIEVLQAHVAGLAARLLDHLASSNQMWTPILVDRSARSVIALHAAIRAGVGFVPLDDSTPAGRIREIIDRLGVVDVALVADEHRPTGLPPEIVRVAVPSDLSTAPSPSAPPQPVDPEAPSHVVFTSGSTGRPKGVVLPWRVVDQPMLQIDPTARHVGRVRPLNFAAAIKAVGRIALGDSLSIIDPTRLDPHGLLRVLRDHRVQEIAFPPSLVAAIGAAVPGSRVLPDLVEVTFGGEPADWSLVTELRRIGAPGLTVTDGLGASEVGWVTRYRIGPDTPIGVGRIPLGPAIDPDRLRLVALDEPTPDGRVPTQLLVGDPNALEYLGDPESTAARFVIDSDGRRWWISGDLVSVDDDGLYHHRGRIDDMAKINGLLVEPAEAEAALRAMTGIIEVAVVVQTTPSGKPRLVAHVCVDDSVRPEALRAELVDRLPAHLVPAMIVRHDTMPLNPNDKIDRHLLSTSTWTRWRSRDDRAPRTELDYWLADQVTRIIDLDQVTAFDDVWDAGLDSLGAVELCAIIADSQLGDIQPDVLLTHRTPAALIDHLMSTTTLGIDTDLTIERSSTVVLNSDGTRPPLIILPGAGGTAFAFRSLATELGPDQPLFVIEPRGLHVPGPVDSTLEALIAHAVDEATTHLGGRRHCVVIGYSGGAPIGFELVRRLRTAGFDAAFIALDASPTRRPPTITRPRRRRLRDRLARRSPLAHLRSIPDYIESQLVLRRARRLHRHPDRLRLRPGTPIYRRDRYQAFGLIMTDAIADYQPDPQPIDATLIHITGNDHLVDLTRPLVDSLEVVTVGGDHFTMLHHPHITTVADTVRRATDHLDVDRLDVNR